MSATSRAATSTSPTGLIAAYRRFRQLGFDDGAAANLTAVAIGVPVAPRPWKVGELTHLAFLRELARTGPAWKGQADTASVATDPSWRLPERTAARQERPEGRITLLSLLQAAAGQQATFDVLAPRLVPPSAPPDLNREGG